MNRLANLIRRMSDETVNIDLLEYLFIEKDVIKPINGLMRLSGPELQALIQQKGGPQDWMILPCHLNPEKEMV